MRHIPNFLTSLNLASGFISIIFIFSGDLVTASWLIIAASVFDFLDGFAARALKAYSAIGRELDSLADVVSFGVAPGLIIFYLLNANLNPYTPEFFSFTSPVSILYLLIPAIMPVCAALRLAIFNLDTEQSTSFRGLPTPANAIAVITFVLGARYSGSDLLNAFLGSPMALIILSLSLSILMVTKLPLLSLKFKSIGLRGNEGRYLIVIICAAMILGLGFVSLPAVIPVYIIVSLVSLLF